MGEIIVNKDNPESRFTTNNKITKEEIEEITINTLFDLILHDTYSVYNKYKIFIPLELSRLKNAIEDIEFSAGEVLKKITVISVRVKVEEKYKKQLETYIKYLSGLEKEAVTNKRKRYKH